MSADEFWKEDPQLFVSYRISFINRKNREIEENDYKSWRQGLYIYHGNGILMRVLTKLLINMFSSSKDNEEIAEYPKKPYFELEKEDKEKKQEKEREERRKNYQNSLNYYGSLKQRYLDKLTGKQVNK